MNGSSNQSPGLQWKWVLIGVAVGAAIAATAFLVVLPTFNAPAIQALVLLAGFIATGGIVGYASPGVTIKEASVAGGLVALLAIILLYATGKALGQDMLRNLLLLALGFGLSWIGAWMGEKLQGSEGHSEEEMKRLFTDVQAKWVIVGVILGFALNVLTVFIFTPIFNVRLDVAFGAFLLSLTVTGFVVAYKSPGVTLKEPAIAGFLAVLLDWSFLEFMLDLHVSGGYLAFGLILGFCLALFGAWLGEKYQMSVENKEAESVASA
ncbi:MAG: hypothetical protein HY563_00050 [Ignavibacteriales bacterium]|nr:hypothetical protein [Ignavibacteriales bacterium]